MAVPARTKYIILAVLLTLASINFTRTALEILENSKRLDTLSQEVVQLEEEKQQLERDVVYKNTDEFIEEKARNDLNLIKPGEKVYVIPKELKGEDLQAQVAGQKTIAERIKAGNLEGESNIMLWVALFFDITAIF